MNDMGKIIAIGIFPEGMPPKKQQVVKPKEVTEPVKDESIKTEDNGK